MSTSVYYPASALRCARTQHEPWAAEWRRQIVEAAAPWRTMPDQALWELMFSHRITRAWQVWSNGHCPVCHTPLPEYTWVIEALARPWKVRCPKCHAIFPTNDFAAFYRSGLDAAGLFDPAQANRALLFHPEHPDPADPLHTYGVDDGEGWTDGTHRWRFIGAYLIYGQWKQLILAGINRCAGAYVVTGDPVYAHKALLLLDRVADVYPLMDYSVQGLVYEIRYPSAGYVSVWHDACAEISELALAFDAVRPALAESQTLVSFLGEQARRLARDRAKDSIEAIQANIERNLLQHTLDHEDRIKSNFPMTDLAVIRVHSVLDAAGRKTIIEERMDTMLAQATAVNGTTGEKGLNGYASYTSSGMFHYLAHVAATDRTHFHEILVRHPRIVEGVRFFLDCWCLKKFYPSCGDAGAFTMPQPTYSALAFESYRTDAEAGASAVGVRRSLLPGPSSHAFLWELYKATGDVDLVRLSCKANDSADGRLRFGLLAEVPPDVQEEYQRVLAQHGTEIQQASVDKQEWHLAILRSGRGAHERCLWLDYDTGRSHHHFDGQNVGLFAFGQDLLPDFGYPPTGYGGHETREAMWYVHTAAHNTVVVNGKCQPGPHWVRDVLAAGRNTLWVERPWIRGLRNDAPAMYQETRQYERTLWLTDVSDTAFYVLDIFRVLGGNDHAALLHSGQAVLATPGLNPVPLANFVEDALVRNLRVDPGPPANRMAEFQLADPHHYGDGQATIRLRVHDRTPDAEAGTLEFWVNDGGYNDSRVLWIPGLMTRRRGAEGLGSTFVTILEPFEDNPCIQAIRREAILTRTGVTLGAAHVALTVELADGRQDRYLMLNTGPYHGDGAAWTPGTPVQVPAWDLETDAAAAILRRGPGGVLDAVLCQGTFACCAGRTVDVNPETTT